MGRILLVLHVGQDFEVVNMELEQILREMLSQQLPKALGDNIESITYSDGEQISSIVERSGRFDSKFIQKFTLSNEDKEYYLLSSVIDNPKKDKKYVYLGEIGTILNFSIPRGAFITSDFQNPHYHSLANIDDSPETPTATPLKLIFDTESAAKKESAFVELFQKIPHQARGPDRAFFERGKLSVKFADEAINIDTEPSISIVPRNNHTIVVVRFLTLGNWSKNEKVEYEYEDPKKKKIKKAKIEFAVHSEQIISDAFNLLQHTMNVLERFKVDTKHTSQMTGGLVNYLAFELARREIKPEENLTFVDFLQDTPTVREVVSAMGTANPGFEIAPVQWTPSATMNYDGKKFIQYHYRKNT